MDMKTKYWMCAAAVLLAMMAAPSAAGTPQGQRAPAGQASRRAAAVIPFTNITGQRTDDWIGPGIAETVTADLRTIDGLAIIGREAILDALKSLGSSERAEPDERVAMDGMFTKLAAVRPGDALQEHPAFGVLTFRTYGALMARHTEHHFRQFGL